MSVLSFGEAKAWHCSVIMNAPSLVRPAPARYEETTSSWSAVRRIEWTEKLRLLDRDSDGTLHTSSASCTTEHTRNESGPPL